MAYQAHSGPGQHPGYQQGDAGPNDSYFETPEDDNSEFSHYKDNNYDKDNSTGVDYHNKEDKDQNNEKEKEKDTLMDAVNKEEKKSKQKEENHDDIHKKAAEEIRHEHTGVNKQPDTPKKKAKDHKSIEDAIKEASRKKEGVFVLK